MTERLDGIDILWADNQALRTRAELLAGRIKISDD